MRVDVVARAWGNPGGGSNGMAIAAAFFAVTLGRLGHDVRQLDAVDGASAADLVITTVSNTWRRAITAMGTGARERLVYWHHAAGLPEGHGCVLAAPPAIAPAPGWSRHVVLPPSSWAAEAGGDCTGAEIIVAGAGPAKGGHVALEVARRLPGLRFYVLQGRSAPTDREPWRALPNAEVAPGIVDPEHFLARARAVLAPTRFEVHPLLLVEAAVRGIPIVCTDMAATRAATAGGATFVTMTAPAEAWEEALLAALARPAHRLRLPPYADVVRQALAEMQDARDAA